MLRRLRIQTRLWLAFGLILGMTALLVSAGGFGLYVARLGIQGITQQLIPATNVPVGARGELLQSKVATSLMIASLAVRSSTIG